MLKSLTAITVFLLVTFSQAFADNFGFVKAGEKYGVDPWILKAISYVESRHNPTATNRNENGSYDSGHMQINNTTWAKHLNGGYEYLETHPEYATFVGAWILRQCQDRYPIQTSPNGVWDSIACYHTGRAISDSGPSKKRLGLIYVNKVYKALQHIQAEATAQKKAGK
jgi:soluble lytic murein transglycosylase-like protein